MKSQAVLSEGGGIRGVSGELNARGPPTSEAFAKLPGEVPSARLDGLPPDSGSE
jgi:hypothetical protein